MTDTIRATAASGACAGVVPYVLGPGGPRLLLIRSMDGRRWVLPKGRVDADSLPLQTAGRKAFEEAGALGRIVPVSLGIFTHLKAGVPVPVEFFPMLVERMLEEWPERPLRRRLWCAVEEALTLLESESMRAPVQALFARLRAAWYAPAGSAPPFPVRKEEVE